MIRFATAVLMLSLLALLGVAGSQDVAFSPVIRGHDLVPIGVDHYVLEADSASVQMVSPEGQIRTPERFAFAWSAVGPDGLARYIEEDRVAPTWDEGLQRWTAAASVEPGLYVEGDTLQVTADVLYAGANYAAMVLSIPVYRQAPIIHGGEGMIARAVVTDEDPGETITCMFVWELQQPDDSWLLQRSKALVPSTYDAVTDTYTSEDTFPAGGTAKRQNWRVRVKAWDGEFESEPVTATVTIRGYAPKIESVNLGPAP